MNAKECEKDEKNFDKEALSLGLRLFDAINELKEGEFSKLPENVKVIFEEYAELRRDNHHLFTNFEDDFRCLEQEDEE
jgi:hypothetical protein